MCYTFKEVVCMELKDRKPNRLGYYDYGTEGSYFVTLCTHHRSHLFEMESSVGNGLCAVPRTPQNQIIHKWLRETQNKFPNITIDKYIIMSDHLHMIVTVKERHIGRSLPDVMHFFKTMTTNEYIRGAKSRCAAAVSSEALAKILLRPCDPQPAGLRRNLEIHRKQSHQMDAGTSERNVGNGLCAVPRL